MLEAEARAAVSGLTEPFPGLRPFDRDEESIFRGRREHTDELLRRLASHRFLAVVGTSGSGKSSLVKAGLRPALERGYLVGTTSQWRVAVMRPGMAPIEKLADALRDEEALRETDTRELRSSSLGLVEAARGAKLAPGESLLVVADQFEEIFRYRHKSLAIDGGAEAALFVNLLLTAAKRPDAPVYVVLTMRSDFLGDCSQFAGLAELLSESQYLIPRLTREQRRQAIEEPLRLFGASMTPQLVERLLNDSGDELADSSAISDDGAGAPDPLPVLQHALMRTYLEWKSDGTSARIDLKHYEKAGRMALALDRHAESVFEKDLDEEGRMWAQRILRCVTTTEMRRPVRRPTHLADLYNVVGACETDRKKVYEILSLFQRPEHSFLQLNRDNSVDISHESLIWKWKRLNNWVWEEDEGAELYRDLAKDARGKTTWGEPKLSSALAVREEDAWNPHWARQYSESNFQDVEKFLERSRKAVRNQKLLRRFGWAAAVAIAILGVWSYYQGQKVAALTTLNAGAAKELETRKQNEKEQETQINLLKVEDGLTREERDRKISEAEAKLKQYREETLKQQATQAQQSNDLAASAKSLQSRLDAALRDAKDKNQKLSEAEEKATQLEAAVRQLQAARDSPKDLAKKETPAPQSSASLSKSPLPQQQMPEQPKETELIGQQSNKTHSLHDVLTRMDRAANDFKSFSAKIKRIDYTDVINEFNELAGTIAIRRAKNGNEVLAQFSEPDPLSLYYDGRTEEFYYPRRKLVQICNVGIPAVVFLDGGMVLMGFGKSAAEWRRDYDVKLIGEENVGALHTAHLELTPRPKEWKEYIAKIDLWISDEQAYPVQEKLTKPSKDYSFSTFSDSKVNPSLPDSAYTLKLPPGVKVERY
jgi:outer membrane lipoprotein-sorting protein